MSGSQQLLLAAVQQAVATDPDFEYTTLLLPGNGTNGAQNNTFLDSSTNNFTVTRNGNTTQGTFSPFSQTGWGNYFDGTGDALTLPSNSALALGSGNFTVEAWVYNQNGANLYPDIFSNSGNIIAFILNDRSSIYRTILSDDNYPGSGNATLLSATGTIGQNAWAHVAWVRSGSTITVYINGTASGTVTSSTNHTVELQVIGAIAQGAGPSLYFWNGYISNLRLVKGTAVYTANFTPPTTPLTAITNTSLLTCQANRFLDASSNAFAITRNGDVSVQAFSPFNPAAAWSAATYGGSGYFDGSGDYLSIANNSAFNLGTNNFCIEGWFYPTTSNATQLVFNKWGTVSDTQSMFQIGRISSTFYAQLKTTGGYVTLSTATWIPNAWNHFAVVRNGSTISAYLNGSRFGTDTSNPTLNSGTDTMTIGSKQAQDYFTGYITDCRIVNGSAIYDPTQTSITVPTAPLTAVTNTAFLSANTNAGIYDATSKNDLETVGNAQISTTQSKFGGSSMYFDGTGDYLYRAVNPNPLGSGDWTIEFWYYQSGGSSYRAAVSTRTAADGGATATVFCGFFGNNMYYDGSTSGGINVVGSTTIVNSTWYHCAYVRSGSTVTVYLNGVSQGSVSDSNNKSNPDVWVGGQNTLYYLNGYINDLRITKGYARYITNFTPPTAAFPLL